MSREKRNPDAQWFIEPDPSANEAIFDHLNKIGRGSIETEHVLIADNYGQLHNVVEVSYKTMCDLDKARRERPELKFNTWNKTRRHAPLRDCSYLFRRKSVLQSADVKRIKEKLAKRKKPPVLTDPTDFEPF